MRHIIQSLLAIILALTVLNAAASPASDPNSEAVQKIVTAFMHENHVPGVAVELYVDGKPYSYYYGYANRETKDPITSKTIFEVGSISKIMTTLLLAQEVDMANVALADSVTKYVPDLPKTFDNVTLLELATHTAGLPFNPPSTVNSKQALLNYLAQSPLKKAPGEDWAYSNVDVGLLSLALENSTKRDFYDLYRRHILNALGMQPVALIVSKHYQPFYAQGYTANDTRAPKVSVGVTPSAFALKISAEDMQRFLSAAIGLPGTPERVFYPLRLTESAYVKLSDYNQGLGWQIHPLDSTSVSALLREPDTMNLGPIAVEEVFARPTFSGNALIDKTGTTDGFRSYIAVLPDKKSGIVILTNKYVSDGAIVRTGRKILFTLTRMG